MPMDIAFDGGFFEIVNAKILESSENRKHSKVDVGKIKKKTFNK